MSTHSKIGASSCEKWWNCPGSITLSESVLPAEQSIYASTGTAAHEVGEFYLKAGLPVDEQFLDEQIEVGDHMVTVKDDMLEAVSVYVDTVLRDLEDSGIGHSRLMVEQRFTLAHIDPEAFGTADAVFVAPFGLLRVYDYKHGQGVSVSVAGNKQMLYYALGAYRSLPEWEACTLSGVETIIVQPRVPGEPQVKRHTYTVDELLEFEAGLREAVERVNKKDQTFSAGKWCRFCDAKAICQTQREWAAELTLKKFKDASNDYGAAVLAELLPVLPSIRKWCGEVESYAHQLLESGRPIDGWKLTEKTGNRVWDDPTKVIETFKEEFGDRIFSEPSLLSPAQLEKVLGKKRKEEVAPLTKRPKTGTSMVPEDSQKAPVIKGAASVFAHLINT